MGMKYTITERTLRKAVRSAILKSPTNKWSINEGFIENFFNSLADTLGELKTQYDNQQRLETIAKLSARHKDILAAVAAALQAKSIARDRNEPGSFDQYYGFKKFNWKDEEVTNVILETLASRLSAVQNNTMSQIARVAELPAIPGLSKDGKSSQTKETDPAKQQESIEAAAKEQAAVIAAATEAVTRPISDIATILEGNEAVYNEINMLIQNGGFGSTAVDFLHKLSHFNKIIEKAQYGKDLTPRLPQIIQPICQQISQTALTGLKKYQEQGNYKDGTAFNALPSDSLTQAAQQKATGGEAKGTETKK